MYLGFYYVDYMYEHSVGKILKFEKFEKNSLKMV